MKNKLLSLLFILVSNLTFSQVNFNNRITLIDETHYSSDVTSIYCKDLNNDNTKDLVVASYYDNSILLYKNIGGDYLHNQRVIISNQIEIPTSVYVNDIDTDGLQDIVACCQGGYIVWYKNLNNNSFAAGVTIANSLDWPRSIVAEDIDNDGDNDLIVGLYGSRSVIKCINNGNGNFQNPVVLYTTPTGTNKVSLYDLDNDGFKDIISGHNDGSLYFSKNLTMGNFGEETVITGDAPSGTAFNFLDVNADGYADVIAGSKYNDNIKYYLNLQGNSFDSGHVIDSANLDPNEINIKDIDNDGRKDIIVSYITNDKIGWFKNLGNGNFSPIAVITGNIDNSKSFTVEDVNNDGFNDIITSSYNQSNNSLTKLSYFLYKPSNNIYKETIINFYPAAVNKVKIADLNNDGRKDIISAYKSIVWNKNYNDNSFSSYKMISNSLAGQNDYTYDIEIKDLDNDNDLDIVAVTNVGLDVYSNQGNETFQLTYSATLPALSREIEISDVNGDNLKDIIIAFTSGTIRLGWIPNLNGGNFGSLTQIPTSGNGALQIQCGDIDNDGDKDILTSSGGKIQWLENDGNGNFQYHLIRQSIPTDPIILEDFDNDGLLDIASGGSDSYSPSIIYWIKNNGNGSFSNPITIHNQSAKALYGADINNDNLKDIIGVSYQSYSPFDEKLFCYLNNGTGFGNQIVIDNLGTAASLERHLSIADLNNDAKLDIVTSYYFMGRVDYYINSSNLEVFNVTFEEKDFILYPVPFTDYLKWDVTDSNISPNYDIGIYTEDGKNILQKNNITTNTLNLEFLNRGVYLIHIKYGEKKVVKKIIKK